MKNQNRRILTRTVATPLRKPALQAVVGGFVSMPEIETITGGGCEPDACDTGR